MPRLRRDASTAGQAFLGNVAVLPLQYTRRAEFVEPLNPSTFIGVNAAFVCSELPFTILRLARVG
jgi:hypothetical protein